MFFAWRSSRASSACAVHATVSARERVPLSASRWYRSPPGRYSIANTTLMMLNFVVEDEQQHHAGRGKTKTR